MYVPTVEISIFYKYIITRKQTFQSDSIFGKIENQYMSTYNDSSVQIKYTLGLKNKIGMIHCNTYVRTLKIFSFSQIYRYVLKDISNQKTVREKQEINTDMRTLIQMYQKNKLQA